MTDRILKRGGNMDYGMLLTALIATALMAALQLLKRKLLAIARQMGTNSN